MFQRHVHFDRRMASGRRRDFRLQRFNRNRGILALDAVEISRSSFSASAAPTPPALPESHALHSMRSTSNPLTASSSAILPKITICGRKIDDDGHQHTLDSTLPSARFQMLLEEHALVSDVLVDNHNPSPFTATMKLALTCPAASNPQFARPRQSRWRLPLAGARFAAQFPAVEIGTAPLPRQTSLPAKRNPLLHRLHRRVCKIKSAVDPRAPQPISSKAV